MAGFRLLLGDVLEFLKCLGELSQIEVRQPQFEFIERKLSELSLDSQQILQSNGIVPPAQQSLPKTQRVFCRIGIELNGASQLTDRGFILLSPVEKQTKIAVRFSSIRPSRRSLPENFYGRSALSIGKQTAWPATTLPAW